MDQLARLEIVHRDLATRNVLMFRFDAANHLNISAKICDFGLSRRGALHQGTSTVSASQLPVRWMAPEVLLF